MGVAHEAAKISVCVCSSGKLKMPLLRIWSCELRCFFDFFCSNSATRCRYPGRERHHVVETGDELPRKHHGIIRPLDMSPVTAIVPPLFRSLLDINRASRDGLFRPGGLVNDDVRGPALLEA